MDYIARRAFSTVAVPEKKHSIVGAVDLKKISEVNSSGVNSSKVQNTPTNQQRPRGLSLNSKEAQQQL